jgi:hypothetical protein
LEQQPATSLLDHLSVRLIQPAFSLSPQTLVSAARIVLVVVVAIVVVVVVVVVVVGAIRDDGMRAGAR